jgi:chromosome segregation ATPase
MAFHAPQTTETDKEAELTTTENALHAAQTKAHVAMALSALDSRYKENLATYADALHACIHHIETARIELEHLKEKRRPYREALLASEKEIDQEMRMLERLSEQYVQKDIVITELKKELASVEETPSQTSLPYRENELASLKKEIENLELLLLELELDRQNHLLLLEPIEQEIRAKEKHLRQLEAEKHYIESSHLHRITQVATEQQPKLLTKDDEEK